jgi:hypothetical protein
MTPLKNTIDLGIVKTKSIIFDIPTNDDSISN